MHPTAWNKICLPKAEGDLGIRSLEQTNNITLMKLGWRMLDNPTAIWAETLKCKYGGWDGLTGGIKKS